MVLVDGIQEVEQLTACTWVSRESEEKAGELAAEMHAF
jgi:hypothetical protein